VGATQLPGAVAVGRTYSYEDEATCDKHVDIFLQAIATGAKLPGQGFAAIKVIIGCSCAALCQRTSGTCCAVFLHMPTAPHQLPWQALEGCCRGSDSHAALPSALFACTAACSKLCRTAAFVSKNHSDTDAM
jgi:hypothetical protein